MIGECLLKRHGFYDYWNNPLRKIDLLVINAKVRVSIDICRCKMDRIDKKILELLQLDAQISNQDLAEQVALSPSPCSRRVKHLEEEGYISKYVALLNPEKLGLELTIMVAVELDTHDSKKLQQFEKKIATMSQVTQCYMITGQAADYMLKVMVPTLNDYQSFLLNKLTVIDGVSNVHSSFVLRRIVEKTALPLKY